jgi:hypothetical protein
MPLMVRLPVTVAFPLTKVVLFVISSVLQGIFQRRRNHSDFKCPTRLHSNRLPVNRRS